MGDITAFQLRYPVIEYNREVSNFQTPQTWSPSRRALYIFLLN